MKHPHARALLNLAGFSGLALLGLLVAGGLALAGVAAWLWLWSSLAFLAFFGGMAAIIWFLGWRQQRQAQEFLESERVLVQWTYAPQEWERLLEERWQEEKGDWKVQLGCLAFLLALAGMLTGAMLGWDADGWQGALVQGMVGMLVGGSIGGLFGGVVAGTNTLGAWLSRRQVEPGRVALGVNEVYASEDYFRGDGEKGYIQAARLRPGPPAVLELHLVVPPRPRMPVEEEWAIPVPPGMVGQVEAVIRDLSPSG